MTITCSNLSYVSGSLISEEKGAKPVPVDSKNNRLPGFNASKTRVIGHNFKYKMKHPDYKKALLELTKQLIKSYK